MSAIKALVILLALLAVLVLQGAYAWRQGFEAGADTVLCLGLQQQLGPEVGMRERPCQNIKGKSPPPLQQWFADEPAYEPGDQP